ncbi:MAG: cytochrome d ubiquinol oxidase subunit II [Streptosporangiaceae bacterium]
MRLDLARWQFALTSINHFLFVPVTIGLAAGLDRGAGRRQPGCPAADRGCARRPAAWHPGRGEPAVRRVAGARGDRRGRLVLRRPGGWAFAATTGTMALCILSIFAGLYPRVLVSSISPGYDLTVANTAAGDYSLNVMTATVVVVVVLLLLLPPPLVLACQGWNFWVFRRRLRAREFGRD